LNFLSLGKLNKLGLLPSARTSFATYNNLEDKMYDIYLERKKD